MDAPLGPNFFLVGAMKAGTTAVFESLGRHPHVYCSPIKEPNFFSDEFRFEKVSSKNSRNQFDVDAYVNGPMDRPVHGALVRDPATYYALFRLAKDQTAIGEASTSYLYSTSAARNIHSAVPHARVIMILRNPVDRAVSQYHMESRIGLVNDPFGSLLERDLRASDKTFKRSGQYVELGRYVKQIQRYLAVFPERQIKIVLYDDLSSDFDGVTDDILRFLDVDPELRSRNTMKTNGARVPRAAGINQMLHRVGLKQMIGRSFPQPLLDLGKRVYYRKADGNGVTEADRQRLRAVLADEVTALSELLARDLSHWLRS
jgi:Sulfotransferase family